MPFRIALWCLSVLLKNEIRAEVSAITTGRGSGIAAKPGKQVVYPLRKAGITAECRGSLVDAHGMCPERVRRWIFCAVGAEHSYRQAVLGDGNDLAGLDAGQDLCCLLVQFTGCRLHNIIELTPRRSSGRGPGTKRIEFPPPLRSPGIMCAGVDRRSSTGPSPAVQLAQRTRPAPARPVRPRGARHPLAAAPP